MEKRGINVFLENTTYTIEADMNAHTCKIETNSAEMALLEKARQIYKEAASTIEVMNQQREANKQDSMKMMLFEMMALRSERGRQAKADALAKANPDSDVAACLLMRNLPEKFLLGDPWMLQRDYAGICILPGKTHQMKLAELKEKYNGLSDRVKETRWGKKMAGVLELRERTDVGQMAPDMTLLDPDGNKFNLYDVKAKVKLLDFWASWCGPCRAGNPELVKIYKEFHDKGLEIVGVSLDDKQEAWVEAIRQDGLPWKHGSDLDGGFRSKSARLYGVGGIPRIFLLDENNRIISNGGLKGEALREKLMELLQ